MITPEQWTIIEKQANKLYSNLEDEIIKEIAERIANVGYANTVALNDALILQEMGLLYENIIQKVAEENNASVSQIQEIFETAGAKSLEYDDTIYRMAGLIPRPLQQSTSMWQLLGATARKTHNNLSNLVMTTANTSQTQFYNAMNKAYMEVSTGIKSYSQSILDTIKDISNQGTYIEYPSGQHRSIESAVRTNILTSVNQTSGKLQEMRAEEMGWDLVEVSAHAGARPEHAEFQGKVYSLKGLTKGYKTLEEGCDYGSVTGLCGVNCRHTFFPYYKGSTRTYTNKELQELKNEKVTYNGQKISKYDASQIQRKMERQIRQDKKDIAVLQGVLTSNNKDGKLLEDTKLQLANAQTKLKQHNSLLNEFTQQTGLRKDDARLFIGNSSLNNDNKIINNKSTANIILSKELRETILMNYEETRLGLNLTGTPVKDLLDDGYLFKVELGNLNNKIANEYTKAFKELSEEYYSSVSRITQTTIKDGAIYNPHVINRTELNPYVFQSEIFINDNLTDYEQFVNRMKRNLELKQIPNIKEEDFAKYIITHEYAHTLSLISQEKYKTFVGMNMNEQRRFNDKIKKIHKEYITELSKLSEEAKKLDNKFILDIDKWTKEDDARRKEIAKQIKDVFISNYSKKNEEEFFAEAFADAKLGKNPSPYAKKVLQEIDKTFKKR